eukprot:s2701_g2.t1
MVAPRNELSLSSLLGVRLARLRWLSTHQHFARCFCILNSMIPFLLGLSYIGLVIYDRWILAVGQFRGEFCVPDIQHIQRCNWSDDVPGQSQETILASLGLGDFFLQSFGNIARSQLIG